MFKKILVANRGEIALRVMRSCHELGIETVAVHSEADDDALHVRMADQAVCIGPEDPAASYLNIPSLIAAAEITGADAVHPGYGFLSENAGFAEICEACGLTFIGPSPADMAQWGDKVEARALAQRLKLPLNPGSDALKDVEHAVSEAERITFPVMLKASGGGGGRGMRVIRTAQEMRDAFPKATTEAEIGFKNPTLFMERFIEEPRHIEFQVLADGQGDAWVLGERECSIQRRHQKVIEEARSVALSEEQRQDMAATIRRAMIESGYASAGTLEFLLDDRGELVFMEMNTRIQVEHPVTELVTDTDLIAEQIRVAAGHRSRLKDRPITFSGHAIECRINAEDPDTFVPWPGLITRFHMPGGRGIRVDSGVSAGYRVPKSYDSLLAKVVAFGHDRSEALQRLSRALRETWIEGIRTNVALHRRIVDHPDFVSGNISTRFLERMN